MLQMLGHSSFDCRLTLSGPGHGMDKLVDNRMVYSCIPPVRDRQAVQIVLQINI